MLVYIECDFIKTSLITKIPGRKASDHQLSFKKRRTPHRVKDQQRLNSSKTISHSTRLTFQLPVFRKTQNYYDNYTNYPQITRWLFLTVLFANIDLHFDKAFRINFEDRLRNFERKRLNNSKEAIGKECSDN